MLASMPLLPSGFIEPCLPSKVSKPPTGGRWLHEIKIDGYRLLPHRDAERVRLITRHRTDLSDWYPYVGAAIAGLKCTNCIIDGEIASPDESGVPSFNRLQRRQPALLYAFDLLELDGADLRFEPIEVRKATLATLLDKAQGPITLCEYIEGDAMLIFQHACKLGYEGIVSKRAGSRYRSGRSLDWLKMKNPESDAVARERGAVAALAISTEMSAADLRCSGVRRRGDNI